jgi:hypothetical protein
MSSDTTSSDNDIPIFDKFGNDIPIPPFKKETTDTDLYFGLIANPSKSKLDTEKSTSSLHFDNDKKHSNTSSVRQSYKPEKNHHSMRESDRDSHHDNHRSRHSTESSKARYEDVKLSDKSTRSDTEISEKKPVLTGQQLRMKKIELLRKLCDLKSKGYKLSKEYDFNSSIEEMEYEFDLLKSFADRRNGIKLYKNTIINFTNLVEFFNDKYDPFGAHLTGWSEHMSVEVDSYDDVLEELYEKYKGAGKSMPPEIKLLILIGFSASAFHFSSKHMSNMPMSTSNVGGGGGGGIFGGIQSGIAQKIAGMGKPEESKFMSEQELNIKRQREEFKEQDKLMKERMRQNAMKTPNAPTINPASSEPITQDNMNFTNAKAPVNFGSLFGKPSEQNQFLPGGPPSLIIPNNDPRPSINTNQTVKDVLDRLHNRAADNQDTQDESINNDRLLSDTTASESKKRGRKKKPLMTI